MRHLSALLLLLVIFSCKKDEENTNSNPNSVNEEIYSLFNDIYLWYDQLPQLDPNVYSSPYELVDALRYEQFDRWSFLLPREEFQQYFVSGESVGHGFVLSRDESDNVRVALIYPSTNAYAKGVRRGWILNQVNGTEVTPQNVVGLLGSNEQGINNDIVFTNNEGNQVELNLVKQVVEINPVVYSEVLTVENVKIGYFVFQDFIGTAIPEMDSIFNVFKQENINGLIIDLRYNGGGSVDVALEMAGWLTGNEDAGKNLVNFRHNDKHKELDTSYSVPFNSQALDINQVVFIGTDRTASASELMINGMDPFMEVELVGTPTEGKSVGMYSILLETDDLVAFPVSFRYTNSEGDGDFYEGLQPDVLINDDVTHDFGDLNEDMLNAAVDAVLGDVAVTKKSTYAEKNRLIEPNRRISDFMRAF
ncbi:MAG: hypothetical protein HC906_16020 [Bacteroidales bacterium]|nr:hypothetical protein [Bacteroidales bacterium]